MSKEVELLNKQANMLKMQIQEMMSSDDPSMELQEKKNNKINELEVISAKLAEEKLKRNEEEYNKVCRITTSMEYSRVKNKPNRNDLINELKEKREKAKQDFEVFKDIESKYSSNDPEDVPGYIFFNSEVTNKYGLCPFINHNSAQGDSISKQTLRETRIEWLNGQSDNGKLYYDLYEKLEGLKVYNECFEMNKSYEDFFESFQADIFTELQLEIYDATISLLVEYINCQVKTKKIKEKFKIVVNNLSILVNETGLQINKYISLKFNQQIPVNVTAIIKVPLEQKFLSQTYNEKLEEYENNKENLVTSLKYVNNVKKNLKLSLYEYLQEESNKKVVISQQGKYFKKWSELNTDEKLDRFYSFAEYFTRKYLLEPGLIDDCDTELQIENLKVLFKNALDDKSLKYKSLKWNVKKGVIERISVLKWDDSKASAFLVVDQPSGLPAQPGTKKVSSVKSVINKNTEKVINEQIVVFILSRFDNNLKIQELKEQCIEQVKLKLKLKRVLKNDKIEILKKFDEIYQVISNNKNE